jgi:hypothetical protein
MKTSFVIRDIGICKIDIWTRDICKSVLKIGFYNAWHLWSPSQNLDSVKGRGKGGKFMGKMPSLCG